MKTLHYSIIVVFVLIISSVMFDGQAYAPCIEGPGINCNNYPPPSLSQIKSDKLNYEASDRPIVTIVGAPDAVAHLEIDDSSSNIIFTHDINLSPNGTVGYVLNISSYKPGVYSVIATSPISKLTTSFSVGLAPTGGSIVLNPNRNSYLPGDNVIIVGTWMSNTLIQLSLIDPSGISVKSIQTFSDKTGHFSSFNFTIPLNAIPGIWQIGATSGVSHSQVQITINSTLDNNSNIKMDKVAILSPLKQFKSGTDPYFVICRQDLQLVIKSSNNSPACVKSSSLERLLKQGWVNAYDNNGKYLTIKPLNMIKVKNANFTISYNISEDNKLIDASMDLQSKSLVLSLETSSNGTLTVTLPRAMIDAKLPSGNDDKFYVLANGQESVFQEINATTIDRTISIPFTNETHVIEIIGQQII